jgi:hypothetical protein
MPSAFILAPTDISCCCLFCTAALNPAGLEVATGTFVGTGVPSSFLCTLIVLQDCFGLPFCDKTTLPSFPTTSLHMVLVSAAAYAYYNIKKDVIVANMYFFIFYPIIVELEQAEVL